MFTLYTDGSCKNNGYDNSVGANAWALYEDEKLITFQALASFDTTNNREEMKAIINGINYLLNNFSDPFFCTIVTDSSYCERCYKEKWYENWQKNNWQNSKKEPVANQDLWKQIIPFFTDERFSFIRVKGHGSDTRNIFVDNLAQEAAERKKNDNNC